MRRWLNTILLVIITLFTIGSYINSNNANIKSDAIQKEISSLPKSPSIVLQKGEKGDKPINGIDYTVKDGLNSISFSRTETLIEQVPLVGPVGKNAYELWIDQGNTGTIDGFMESLRAPEQQLRVNPDSKDIEFKLSNFKYWTILVLCSEYRLECPQ